MDTVLLKAAELLAKREPYVLVTVVWSAAPSSGKAGHRAVVTASGEMHGWIGGACSQPAVIRECRRALDDGTPRVLCLGEDDHFALPRVGRVHQPITCASEGALEIFIDPQVPPIQLVVAGDTPAALALAGIGEAVGYAVVHVPVGDLPAMDARTFVVVATMGTWDEDALQAALATEAPYVGLVASARRAASVLDVLRSRGVSPDVLARVRAPAGLDLGKVSQEEIAVAIAAEIAQLKAAGLAAVSVAAPEPAEATDPVCGMTVDLATARYKMAHGGVTYAFCCAGCMERFRQDPGAYLVAEAG